MKPYTNIRVDRNGIELFRKASDQMLRVGIIGCGGMGRGRLRYYAQMPDVRVEAIADLRIEELRHDSTLEPLLPMPVAQMRWYDDYRQLAQAGVVDVVDICLPTYVHADGAIAALQGGLHALCEKPMALNPAECDAMLAASAQANRLLMIAQCIRFWPEYDVLTRLLRSGEAGKLLSLQLTREGGTPGGQQHWMRQAECSGGAILDLHIHDIDYCQYLLGMPRRVYAQGGQAVDASRGYDYMLTNLDYGQGLQVSATAHWADVPLPFVARYEARFEKAFLIFDSGVNPTIAFNETQRPPLAIYCAGAKQPECPQLDPHDAYFNEIRYFLNCVTQGIRPARCLPQEARNSVALIQSAIASMQRNDLVETREFVV
jgi:predicted dehydrogenase